jgi:hypothetical protein
VNLRLASFLLAAVCSGVAIWRGWWPLGVAAAATLVAFVVLVRRHGRLSAAHRRAVLRRQLSQESLWRMARDWDSLPAREQPAVAEEHPYAADLDVAGHASLLALIDTTTTPVGGVRMLLGDRRLLPGGKAVPVARHSPERLLTELAAQDRAPVRGRQPPVPADEHDERDQGGGGGNAERPPAPPDRDPRAHRSQQEAGQAQVHHAVYRAGQLAGLAARVREPRLVRPCRVVRHPAGLSRGSP